MYLEYKSVQQEGGLEFCSWLTAVSCFLLSQDLVCAQGVKLYLSHYGEIANCRCSKTVCRRQNIGVNRRLWLPHYARSAKEHTKRAAQKQIAFVVGEKFRVPAAWRWVLLALHELRDSLLDELVIRKWVMARKRRGPRRFWAPARARVGSIHWLLLLKICMSRLAILREI